MLYYKMLHKLTILLLYTKFYTHNIITHVILMRNIINNTCKTLYTILTFYKYIILKSGPAGVAHVTCQ